MMHSSLKILRSSTLLLVALMLPLANIQASAQDLKFENPRIFIPLKGTSVTAGYGKLMNSSSKAAAVELVSVEGFGAVELHETYKDGDNMGMRMISTLEVPAKGSVEMKHGGHHLMLFKPTKEFKEGDRVQVNFKVNGKAWTTSFPLVPRKM